MIDVPDRAVRPRRVVVASPITMGYGSPRYLRLCRALAERGHRVLLVDHEEPAAAGRTPYRLDGLRRLFIHRRRGPRRLAEVLRRRLERPDVLIAGSDELLGQRWPTVSRRVIYFGELESEWRGCEAAAALTDAADAVIAPQEDRLEIARGIYRRAGAFFCVQNAPRLDEHPGGRPRSIDGREKVNLLYQGQIARLTCADVLLTFAREHGRRYHLHLAGPVREDFAGPIAEAAAAGALTYHGYLRRAELAALRARCDVGLVTWREGGELPLSIKYACPNKLYEYIADGLPVAFMPNWSLERWNRRYDFGVAAADYSADGLAAALGAIADDPSVYAARSARNLRLFGEELNFDRQIEPFVRWLEGRRS